MVENAGIGRTHYNSLVRRPHHSGMQNPDGTAAAAQRQQQIQAASLQRETTESIALLREAVLRLTQHVIRDTSTATPTSRLIKLGPEDDMEAYLEIFERTAQRENWPEEQWAHIVAPFLTGPAQQASQDLPAETARQYPALKQAILAYYGHNLAARAQRVHDWRFDVRGAVRTQIAQHGWLVKRWLATRASPIDRVIIDNTIRQLPPGARRVLAHHDPDTVDDLVRQLENWQVAQQLSASTGATPRTAETRRDQRGPTTRASTPSPDPPTVNPESREGRRCYECGQPGHIARYCPGDRDVSMPSAYANQGTSRPCMLVTCWMQGTSGSPTIPARVMDKDTQALLDTGSVVTLLRPDLAGGREGTPMEVACVHGHTRTYETCHVVVRTPHGVFTTRAGIVPHLPVPLLIGRDCPIFYRLWDPAQESRGRREPPRRGAKGAQRAYGATWIPTSPGESMAEDQGSEGNGPSPLGSPIYTGRGGSARSRSPGPHPNTPDTITASEQPDPPEEPESSPLTEFSDFVPGREEGSARPGQFASAQLQDEALKHAWSHVVAHNGQTRDSELLRLLQVKQLRTSVYHPQTDGLVERFNKTLKQMLKKAMDLDSKNWDQLLPHVLFAIREVPQASTGFSLFELLYGRRPRGILDLGEEAWESQPSPHRTTLDHVEQVRDRMAQVWPIVREHLRQAQQAQARVYNRGARLRTFQPGDLVLVLAPMAECKFLVKWQGPYEVVEQVGEVNYWVRQPGRRKPTQVYHINILKQWRGGGEPPDLARAGGPTRDPGGSCGGGPQPGPEARPRRDRHAAPGRVFRAAGEDHDRSA